MKVCVRMFARARDICGADTLDVELATGATVAHLRQALGRQVPRLVDLLARSAVAVDGEFANEDQAVPAEAEVALLPPVSGGEPQSVR